MASNVEPGRCDGDYYCDAAASCGISCAEITLFEANRHAFKAKVDDNAGGGGVGAFCPGPNPTPTLALTLYHTCASLQRLARASVQGMASGAARAHSAPRSTARTERSSTP